MKPVLTCHNDYRSFLRDGIHQYYPNTCAISKETWAVYKQFRDLDLSKVDLLLQDKYSVYGPMPRQPSCMFRSLLLAPKFKVTSVTSWVHQMQITPMYALLSGFSPDDVPGVGTFYDFMSRLWDHTADNYSDHIKPVPCKVKKPKGRGKKADPVEKETVADLITRLTNTHFELDDEAYKTLFRVFSECFLSQSILKGVIHPDDIRLSGDGTPVVTSQRMRSHHTCDCHSNGIFNCSCDRYFSQPDCDIGWILPEISSILGMICMSLLTPKTTFRSFRFFIPLPSMILTVSANLSFVFVPSYPISISLSFFSIPPMTPWLCTSFVNGKRSLLLLTSISATPRNLLIIMASLLVRMVFLSVPKASR